MKVVSASKEVHIAQWPSMIQQYNYQPHAASVTSINSISLSKNTDWLVLVPKSGVAEIISLIDEPKLLLSVQAIKNTTCAAFANFTKRNVALGTNMGQLLIYDIKEKCTKKTLPKVNSPYIKVEYNCKDSYIAGACENGEVVVFNTSTTTKKTVVRVPKSKTLTNFSFHNERKQLISGCSEEGVVAVWDLNIGKPITFATVHKAPVKDLLFRHDAIVSAGLDRRLCFFNYANGSVTSELPLQQTPSSIDLCSDGYNLVVGFFDGQIVGYDLRKMKELVHTKSTHPGRVNRIAFFQNQAQSDQIPSDFVGEPVKEVVQETVDSFGDCLYNVATDTRVGTTDTKVDSIRSTQTNPDSFLDALNFSKSKTANCTPNCQQDVQNYIPDIEVRSASLSPALLTNGPVNINNRTMDSLFKQMFKPASDAVPKLSSTPKGISLSTPKSSPCVVQAMSNEPSPIISGNTHQPPDSAISDEYLKRIVKESVREVIQESMRDVIKESLSALIKEELQELKTEVQYQAHQVMMASRVLTSGLQMSICKEAIKVEKSFDKLNQGLFEP